MPYQLLTIVSGQQNSAEIFFGTDGYRQALEMEIIAPTSLPETVRVQVGSMLGNWADQRTAMQDITLAAGKADFVTILEVDKMRLRSGSAVGADRVFEVIWRSKPR